MGKIWEEIKWQWTIFKTKMYLQKIERHDKYMRRRYCHKGLHKITSCKYSYKEGSKRWVHLHFLKCKHCNYMFFTTKKQKELYTQKEGVGKERFSDFLKALSSSKVKHSKGVGRANKEDVSPSVPSDSK